MGLGGLLARLPESAGKEYDAALGKLLPLKAHLAATDQLVDLIVYRLYGLTDEEVRIVEEVKLKTGRMP